MALSAGTHLGPYCVTAPLGAGGVGGVYRARDTTLDRSVAIKVLTGRTRSRSTVSSWSQGGQPCAPAPSL